MRSFLRASALLLPLLCTTFQLIAIVKGDCLDSSLEENFHRSSVALHLKKLDEISYSLLFGNETVTCTYDWLAFDDEQLNNDRFQILEVFKQEWSEPGLDRNLTPDSVIRMGRITDTGMDGWIPDYLTKDEAGFLAFLSPDVFCTASRESGISDETTTETVFLMDDCAKNTPFSSLTSGDVLLLHTNGEFSADNCPRRLAFWWPISLLTALLSIF